MRFGHIFRIPTTSMEKAAYGNESGDQNNRFSTDALESEMICSHGNTFLFFDVKNKSI